MSQGGQEGEYRPVPRQDPRDGCVGRLILDSVGVSLTVGGTAGFLSAVDTAARYPALSPRELLTVIEPWIYLIGYTTLQVSNATHLPPQVILAAFAVSCAFTGGVGVGMLSRE